MSASAGRRGRLSRSGDFERVYREGRSHANRFLVLYAFPRPATTRPRADPPRASRSAARSAARCERNEVKRVLREAFWALADRLARQRTTSCSSRGPTLPGSGRA